MDHETFVAHVRADADRIADLAATGGLDEPAPTCPGWSVRDVVEHTAEVYLHKVASMRDKVLADTSTPGWPPPRGSEPTPVFFAAARDALLRELTSRDPREACPTWWTDDQTVGFWGRRMAHETAIHRLDVEIALGDVTPVDPDLAVDGIDEVLRRMLAGDWSDQPVVEGAGTVLGVESGGRRWRVVLEPKAVVVTVPRHDEPVDATVSGDPVVLYRWAWGRGGAEGLTAGEDARYLHLLRSRLSEATQ
jgi:uncharacterized protein (TIGR03083 family)